MTIDRKIAAAFASALLVLVVAGFSYAGLIGASDARRLVRTKNLAATELVAVTLLIRESESSERGYLLIDDRAFLAKYEANRGHVDEHIAKITEMFATQPTATPHVQRLVAAIRAKYAEMDEAVQTRDQKGRDAAIAVVAARGLVLMETIRVEIEALQAILQTQLDLGRAEVEGLLKRTAFVLPTGSIIAVLLAVLSIAGVRRDVEERRKTAEQLRLAAIDLEARAVELEAAKARLEAAASEQMKAQALLERSNRDLDQFAYVASHDLKAPLRGIANLSTWVEEDLGPVMTADARDKMLLLRNRVHRMEALIDGILTYSRAGRSKDEIALVSVPALLREVTELLAPPTGATVTATNELPTFTTLKVPLQQVLLNLVSNALKHGATAEKPAAVSVSVKEDGDFYEFSVSDQGPGIEPSYHQRVFGIFQTLASRDKVEGTGIGLAVVQKLVQALGGRVWIESERGHGATFRFTWPKTVPSNEERSTHA